MFHKCVCWLQCSKIDPDLEMFLRCSHLFLGTLAPSDRLDGLSHIGENDEGSELEYAKNSEYLTLPQEGEDRLMSIEVPPPELMVYAPELVVYAPDNEGSSSDEGVVLAVKEIRDGESGDQVRDCRGWSNSLLTGGKGTQK